MMSSMRVKIRFFSATHAPESTTQPSTGSGGESSGGFGYFDGLWNILDSIVSWLQSCAESITQIPSLIWQNVSSLPQLIWNFIKDIPQWYGISLRVLLVPLVVLFLTFGIRSKVFPGAFLMA